MVTYRYVNTNPVPVVVPGKTGGSITVRPNEGTTDPWFSRFVGPNGLTKVPINPVDAPAAPPRSAPSPPLSVPKPMLAEVQARVDEETPDYKRIHGIYHCKRCDLFRTGSFVVIQAHLRTYHGMPNVPPAPPPVEVKEPEVVRTPVVSGEVKSVFTCSLCGHQFTSEDGLTKHVAKTHSEE